MATEKEMMEYLKRDEETFKSFRSLVNLTNSKAIGEDKKETRSRILKAMIKTGCMDNPGQIQKFITSTYFIVEKTPSIQDLLRRGKGNARI